MANINHYKRQNSFLCYLLPLPMNLTFEMQVIDYNIHSASSVTTPIKVLMHIYPTRSQFPRYQRFQCLSMYILVTVKMYNIRSDAIRWQISTSIQLLVRIFYASFLKVKVKTVHISTMNFMEMATYWIQITITKQQVMYVFSTGIFTFELGPF